jgi:general secretion pathway protein D
VKNTILGHSKRALYLAQRFLPIGVHIKSLVANFLTPLFFISLLVNLPPSLSEAQFGQAAKPTTPVNVKAGILTKKQQEKFSRSDTEDITNENFPETIESFDFPNADIADIVKAISELTGRNFILDPGVRGKITIIAPSKITVAEAYKMFLSALAIHGYAIVPSDGYYKVRPSRAAQRDSIETFSSSYYPNSDQMITKIIHLKYISAEEVNRQFRNITTKDGDINAYAPTNSLIISDYGSNIDRIVKIINQLDVPGFEDQIEVVQIRNAKAKDLADLIEKIVNKGQSTKTGGGGISSGFQGAVPRFSRTGSNSSSGSQQGGSYFLAFPDDRTNSLIVVGNKAGIARVRKLVAQLDFRMNPADSGGVYVYYVKHGDAEKIAAVLTGVAKDAGGDSKKNSQSQGGFLPPSFLNSGISNSDPKSSADIFGGDVKITADKNTNSLVVVASKQDYEKVMNLLNRIDIPRDQVFVEAIITEMSDSDANSWKVGYYQFDKMGKGGFNTFDPTELGALTSLTGGNGVIIPFGSQKQVDFTQVTPGANGAAATTSTIKVASILGFINFLKTNQKANILSTPRILALDNQEAQIKVVDKVPTGVTSASTAAGQTSNTTFEEAGIDLKIKPFISPASDTIRMEITQAISQATQPSKSIPSALSTNTTVIAKRELKTFLVIRNNDTAVLGGLVRESETQTESKVPILGDIPVIGWLFKSSTSNKEKLNLMVFLTPKIIRNPGDQRRVLSKSIEERTEFVKDSGGRDPFGKKMDQVRNYVPDSDGNVTEPDNDDFNLNATPPQSRFEQGVNSNMNTRSSKAPAKQNTETPSPAEMEDSTLE